MSKQTRRNRTGSWPAQPVSAIADINPTMQLPREVDDTSVPLYEMAAIDESTGEVRDPQMVPLQSGRSGRTKFRNSDVLFAKITPCVQNGKSALVRGVPGDLAFGSSEFYVLRPHPHVLPEFLFYFVRQRRVVEAAVASFTGTSGRQRVPRDFWDAVQVPVPPLPVQVRIVEILAKTAEIRRKRQEALNLADSIIAAAFINMFGDPLNNGDRFDRVPLGELADVRSGVTKGRKLQGKETADVPYLRVANVQDGFLDLDDVRTIEVLPADVERYRLQDGDILMIEGCGNPNYLGRGTVWREEIKNCIHQNHVFRARVDRVRLLPEYLATLLQTRYANQYFLSCAKNSSGLSNINSTQVKAFEIPLAPVALQKKFVLASEQWGTTARRLKQAQQIANATFAVALHRAFTGELTVEWEQANADEIARSQQFQEALPRLALLAVLAEAARRSGTAVLVTALMKYVFLLQMETNGRRRLYQFVPYQYGPFARELYADLGQLQQEGFINVDNDTDEDKTRITIADAQRIEQSLDELPDELRDDVCTVLDEYGELDHNRLLKTVYKKYPAYAQKSRLLKKTKKKAVKRSRRPK